MTAEVLLIDPNLSNSIKKEGKVEDVGLAGLLEQLHFRIVIIGTASITILGPLNLFEKIFDFKFKKQERMIMENQSSVYYVTVTQPKIPKKLMGLISSIVFPVPPTFFLKKESLGNYSPCFICIY
jgi:hypothetical protein